jgi:endonuclease/exonuclease/phosphatase (EEP) superfamily protein YafD
MKFYLTCLILLVICFSQLSQSQMMIPWNQKREPCNFKCKEIPSENEVLEGFGRFASTELVNPKINVLAWNVYKGRKEPFFRDLNLLARGKDLIMLSEATDDEKVKPGLNSIPYGWIMGISFFMKQQFATGLVTGSYAQPRFIGYTRTTDLEPFVKSPKVILINTFWHRPSQSEILVMNIHGINWVTDEKFERQIRSILPYVSRHKGPILFAGDFNIYGPNRLNIVKNTLAPYGIQRVNWENPPLEKQYDDAFIRGFKVLKARYIHEVKDFSSDHPALDLELLPTNLVRRR